MLCDFLNVKVPFLASWTDLLENGAPDLLSTHLSLLRFNFNTYKKEKSHQWCEWMWCSVGRWWRKKKLVDIWSEWIEIILLTFSWLCSPAECDAIIFVPNRKQLLWFHDERCPHGSHGSSMSFTFWKKKIVDGAVTGKTVSSSAPPPGSTNAFPSSSVSPSLGLIPFLFQVVWEVQFTFFHYPEHSPLMLKPRSSDAYKSLTSIFMKVFNLTCTVASSKKSWCQWWRTYLSSFLSHILWWAKVGS